MSLQVYGVSINWEPLNRLQHVMILIIGALEKCPCSFKLLFTLDHNIGSYGGAYRNKMKRWSGGGGVHVEAYIITWVPIKGALKGGIR